MVNSGANIDGSCKDRLGDKTLQNYPGCVCGTLGSGFVYIVGKKCPHRNSKTPNHLNCGDQSKVPTRKKAYKHTK